ncbi:alpha/beta fold hydrolase [Cryptosporangium aurantiacum]|uniref:Pimeloyl-ACP methyl ester carboxylesterase n=1 Tax=Cryptosporangium aurantiacum TaxID=134849 RepID=A0A1M7QB64_9ACTN|nr:alpha/beta fold hydrolase [Cryptosporangium aurantiacum]SHN28010.1 Pimeloyl-ACP methyl ester carboxylesterase [Cryptosporangium aurantiacum]
MTLVYDRRGSGSPLVLFHGIGHRWQAWEPVLDRLAEHHDVIAVDLPGFGRSPLPADGPPATIDALVAEVARWLNDDLGIERPHVAGNSLGGAVALELAKANLVSTATALAPAGFFRGWEIRWALTILRSLRAASHLPEPVLRMASNVRWLRALTFGTLVAHPTRISAERAFGDTLALRDATAFGSLARGAAGYEFRGQPGVPVTIAWGTRDRILLPRQAERATRRLPTARHVTLPRCGHVPMSDAPELVASTILATVAAAPRLA